MYKEWTGHRTTAFKVVLSVRFACIKHVTVLNLVEYFSFPGLFLISRICVVSLHSFAVYHNKVYEEWNGHRTTAFKGVVSVSFAFVKHVMIFKTIEYCSSSGLFFNFTISTPFHYTLLQYIIVRCMQKGLGIEPLLLKELFRHFCVYQARDGF